MWCLTAAAATGVVAVGRCCAQHQRHDSLKIQGLDQAGGPTHTGSVSVFAGCCVLACCCCCRFQPPEKFAPFVLSPGLCYNDALENAASAMEVAAVAAKNCALLVQQHIQQQQEQERRQQQQLERRRQRGQQRQEQHSANMEPHVAEE